MSISEKVGEWRSRVNPFVNDSLVRLEAHGCTFGWAELEDGDEEAPTEPHADPSFIVWHAEQPIAGWGSGDLQTRIHRAVRLAEARLGLATQATV